MSGYTTDSTELNQAAAHDTGLYDPTIHDNQIVALYETDAQARAAQQMLVDAGFPASSMQVMGRGTAAGATMDQTQDEGLWGSIKSLFVADEDRTTYNTAVAHGHSMLVVTPDHTMDRQHLIHVLETTDPMDFDAKLEEWRQAGYTGTTAAAPVAAAGSSATGYASSSAPTTGIAHTGAAHTGVPDSDTIKVMEERLRVGKREVASGAVRVRSYIVERPVEEQIRLREERVTIERHPVDRIASTAEFGAFQERTIEARATSEEAVVSKDAHVIEEIGLNKQATERTETVHDTLRKTEVEIEDADSVAKKGTLGSTTATGTATTLNPNATPGAGTSGTNTPR